MKNSLNAYHPSYTLYMGNPCVQNKIIAKKFPEIIARRPKIKFIKDASHRNCQTTIPKIYLDILVQLFYLHPTASAVA
jgi:hypothetical protein